MTREDFIRMAKEAGIEFFNSTDPEFHGREYCEAWIEEQHAFAERIAAAEREACAKLCDEVGEDLYQALMREGRFNENAANNARAAAQVCSTELRNGRYAEEEQS